jgi:hypothetical protein
MLLNIYTLVYIRIDKVNKDTSIIEGTYCFSKIYSITLKPESVGKGL